MTKQRKHIKVTYSTLGSPDPLLHEYFEEDVAALKANLGKTYKMLINGDWVEGDGAFEHRSPINTDWLLGLFPRASDHQVNQAVAAAKAAFPAWRATPWRERCDLLGKVADLISERLFEISAAVSLEIGKNRLEAIGDVEETADAWKPSAMSKKRPISYATASTPCATTPASTANCSAKATSTSTAACSSPTASGASSAPSTSRPPSPADPPAPPSSLATPSC